MRRTDSDSHRRVIIGARVRPFTARELQSRNNELAVEIPEPGLIKCTKPTSCGVAPPVFFRVEHTFSPVSEEEGDMNLEQLEVYEKLGRPILMSALEGYNACLFAYGVTSSGKTYSMFGSPENPGIIPRLVEDLFDKVSRKKRPNCRTTVQLSFFEIYKEKLIDLLQPKSSTRPLAVREHPATGPFVEGLLEPVVRSPQEVFALLRLGDSRRKVSSTAMNERSSRSHTIATLLITRREMAVGALRETVENVFTSKLNLVDLAGSERQSCTLASSARLEESCHINKSLFTLGKVISQLSDEASGRFASRSTERGVLPMRVNATPMAAKATAFRTPQVDCGHRTRSTTRQPYISYRDSLLTWILKESLGGNSVTAMLATLSPSSLHYEDTLSTLQYAKRAHSIVNTAVINEDPEGKLIRELMSEIDRLRWQANLARTPSSPLASQIKNLKALLRARECEVAFLTNELTRRTTESAYLRSESQRVVDQLVEPKFIIPPPRPFQSSQVPAEASRTPLKALNVSPLQLSKPKTSLPSRALKYTGDEENSPADSTYLRDRWAPDGQDATSGSSCGILCNESITAPTILGQFLVSTVVDDAHSDGNINSALLPTCERLDAKPVGAPSADQETQTEGQTPIARVSVAVSAELELVTSKQLTEQGTNTSFVSSAAEQGTNTSFASLIAEQGTNSSFASLTAEQGTNTLFASSTAELGTNTSFAPSAAEQGTNTSFASSAADAELVTAKQLVEQGTNTSFAPSAADAESPAHVSADFNQELQASGSDVAVFESPKLVDVGTCTADDGMAVVVIETAEFLSMEEKLRSLLSETASLHNELINKSFEITYLRDKVQELSDANKCLTRALVEAHVAISKQKKTLIDCSTSTLPSEIGFDVIAVDHLAQLQGDLQNLKAKLSIDRRDMATCTADDVCADPEKLSIDLADSVHSHVLDMSEKDRKGQHKTLAAHFARRDPLCSLPPNSTVGTLLDTVSLQKLTDVQGVLSTLRSRLEAEQAVRRADRVSCNEATPAEEDAKNTKLMAKLASLNSQLAVSARSRAQLKTELSNLRFKIEELEGEKEILQFEADSSRRLLDLTQKENSKLRSKYTKAVDLLTKYLRESGQPWPSQLYTSDI